MQILWVDYITEEWNIWHSKHQMHFLMPCFRTDILSLHKKYFYENTKELEYRME